MHGVRSAFIGWSLTSTRYLVGMIKHLLFAPLLLLLASCTDITPRGGGDILVLGDSVMAWNGTKNASIGDELGRILNRDVTSKAVPGAQFNNASGVAGAVGFDIQRQYQKGRWKWVVVNGGANDLSADCGCGACAPFVEALIGADATSGAMPDFMRKLRAETGAQVIWMGYYAGSGSSSFAGCRDDLVEIESRIARFAATQSGVHFVDAEDVIDRGDATLFAPDDIHPSAKGSARIADQLAQVIRRVKPNSQTER